MVQNWYLQVIVFCWIKKGSIMVLVHNIVLNLSFGLQFLIWDILTIHLNGDMLVGKKSSHHTHRVMWCGCTVCVFRFHFRTNSKLTTSTSTLNDIWVEILTRDQLSQLSNQKKRLQKRGWLDSNLCPLIDFG